MASYPTNLSRPIRVVAAHRPPFLFLERNGTEVTSITGMMLELLRKILEVRKRVARRGGRGLECGAGTKPAASGAPQTYCTRRGCGLAQYSPELMGVTWDYYQEATGTGGFLQPDGKWNGERLARNHVWSTGKAYSEPSSHKPGGRVTLLT